jgi:hypothetical protein
MCCCVQRGCAGCKVSTYQEHGTQYHCPLVELCVVCSKVLQQVRSAAPPCPATTVSSYTPPPPAMRPPCVHHALPPRVQLHPLPMLPPSATALHLVPPQHEEPTPSTSDYVATQGWLAQVHNRLTSGTANWVDKPLLRQGSRLCRGFGQAECTLQGRCLQLALMPRYLVVESTVGR